MLCFLCCVVLDVFNNDMLVSKKTIPYADWSYWDVWKYHRHVKVDMLCRVKTCCWGLAWKMTLRAGVVCIVSFVFLLTLWISWRWFQRFPFYRFVKSFLLGMLGSGNCASTACCVMWWYVFFRFVTMLRMGKCSCLVLFRATFCPFWKEESGLFGMSDIKSLQIWSDLII